MSQKPYEDDRPWDKRMEELYAMLSEGTLPEGVEMPDWKGLGPDQAMSVIWFLQVITHTLPDHFGQCSQCKVLVNTCNEGAFINEQQYCDDCACAVEEIETPG